MTRLVTSSGTGELRESARGQGRQHAWRQLRADTPLPGGQRAQSLGPAHTYGGGGRGISFHIFKGGVSKTLWTYLKPDTVCFLPTNYSRFSHLQSTPTLPWTAARVRPLQARSSEAQA